MKRYLREFNMFLRFVRVIRNFFFGKERKGFLVKVGNGS